METKLTNSFNKYQCPCCGYYTLEEKPTNTFQTCPVCNWEDDGVQYQNPDYKGGANNESLNQAKANFKKFGVSNLLFQEDVRPANETELP